MQTIDITPTHEETCRIWAYLFAGHTSGRPEDYIGNYWKPSENQLQVMATMITLMNNLQDSLEAIGIDLWEQSKTFKTKLIKNAHQMAVALNPAEEG